MSFRTALLVGLLFFVVPATAAAQWDSTTALLLAHADTSAALTELRQRARVTDAPEAWCDLARLLTSMATIHQATWRIRQEASEAFARGLRDGGDARCLYAYALLKEKQGARLDAQPKIPRRAVCEDVGGALMWSPPGRCSALMGSRQGWATGRTAILPMDATVTPSQPGQGECGFVARKRRRAE